MVVFLIITSLLSLIAAIVFVTQVNMRVLCRTSKDTTVDTKMYGDIHTVFLALLFLAMMVIIGFLSKFPAFSCALALVISTILVMANTYLKGKKIHATLAMISLWFGFLCSSLKDSGFTFKTSNWLVKTYIVLQLICGALILVGTAVVNYRNYYGISKKKDRVKKDSRISADLGNTLAVVIFFLYISILIFIVWATINNMLLTR